MIPECRKNISSELLDSFGRQLTETEDIKGELHKAIHNRDYFSKEGDACQEEKIYKHFLKNVPMQLYNVDNFLKFQKSVQKIFFQNGRQ